MIKSYQKRFMSLMFGFHKSNFATMAVREAINSAMSDEIERDSRVFLIGTKPIALIKFRRGSWPISRSL